MNLERELKEIKDRLDTLTLLYRNILNLLIKEERPLPDEKEAIESEDDVVSEEELLKALRE